MSTIAPHETQLQQEAPRAWIVRWVTSDHTPGGPRPFLRLRPGRIEYGWTKHLEHATRLTFAEADLVCEDSDRIHCVMEYRP